MIKEAAELLDALETDLQSVTDKAQALRLALQCEPDNCIILRLDGIEKVYTIDEPNPKRTGGTDQLILDVIERIKAYSRHA